MLGVRLTRLFAIKSLFKKNPNLFLSITIILTVYSFAYMLKVIEGPVYQVLGIKDYVDYSRLENCMWTVLVTMTSGNK